MKAFEDAQSDKNSALHAWGLLTADGDASSLNQRWSELAGFWQNTLRTRRDENDVKFQPMWDLSTRRDDWFGSGTGFAGDRVAPEPAGAFTIESDGERVVTGIHKAGIFSHGLSTRHTGVLSSPRFIINSNAIAVRAFGKNARVRLVIENYPRGNGGIYPAVTLDRNQSGWHVLNCNYRIGQRGYLQIETNLAERAYFAVDRIVSSDDYQPPSELTVSIVFLLQGDQDKSPATVDEVADRYVVKLTQAVRSWQSGSINDDEVAYLDFFVRRGLLPTTMSALPADVRELIEEYRELEKQITVPRRAPGLLETIGHDQPLFERGQHTNPGDPVPRRGLSLFDDRPFDTTDSGRLQLAEQTASAANPLTARVLVNRLWH